MKNQPKGVSIVVAVLSMVILGTMVLVLASMTAMESKISLGQIFPKEALYGAEAFLERGIGALIDDANGNQTSDVSLAGYCATLHVDGYTASFSPATCTDPTYACFYDGNAAILSSGGELALGNFEEKYNLMTGRIKEARMAYRFRVAQDGSLNPLPTTARLIFTKGSGAPTFAFTYNTPLISNTSFGSVQYSDAITGGTLNWRLASMIDNICVQNTGSYNLYIDYFSLRYIASVDAITEPWARGSFVSSLNLGKVALVDTIKIEDEQGKLHLNYAPQHFIRWLLEECGVNSANTKANDIVNYRSSNTFDSIEELKQVSSITAGDFNAVKNYITVHSWVNDQVALPSGTRAPINVNTADYKVLKALFDPPLENQTDAGNLATAIINRRITRPFTSMYSSYTYSGGGDENCFATFVDGLSVLNANQKLMVKAVADASDYNKTLYEDWNGYSCTTATDLCYSSNVYLIKAKARRTGGLGLSSGAVELKEIVGFPYDYSTYLVGSNISLRMPVYGEASPKVYWKQIF